MPFVCHGQCLAAFCILHLMCPKPALNSNWNWAYFVQLHNYFSTKIGFDTDSGHNELKPIYQHWSGVFIKPNSFRCYTGRNNRRLHIGSEKAVCKCGKTLSTISLTNTVFNKSYFVAGPSNLPGKIDAHLWIIKELWT